MKIPWCRRRLLVRRQLDRWFLDLPDAILRHMTGRGDWPPYSLRSFVGGANSFGDVGTTFLDEFWRLGLLRRGTRILDVGCGCGRIARALAADQRLKELGIFYTGMDVDRDNIGWCRSHIARSNDHFSFYHADCYNPTYNPQGSTAADAYAFPHPDSSCDVILLTSVLTHLLEQDLSNYLAEAARVLAPGGVIYASMFLYESLDDAAPGAARHGIPFPFRHGNCAVNCEEYPTNAVAYSEAYLRTLLARLGLETIGPVMYGLQDIVILGKAPGTWAESEPERGWHALEDGCFRWTERTFAVRLRGPVIRKPVLRFRFYLPGVLIEDHGPLRLSAAVKGLPLRSVVYDTPGEQLYVTEIPEEARTEETIVIDFELDKARPPSPSDWRELGLVVSFHESSGRLRRPLEPFLLSQE
ncbi:MAG: class I SAM-dependent methyltransferase [Bryobacterales bacterium]|nr:class I SAM-dependent methyltransferase [Bryobacterales bacterium]